MFQLLFAGSTPYHKPKQPSQHHTMFRTRSAPPASIETAPDDPADIPETPMRQVNFMPQRTPAAIFATTFGYQNGMHASSPDSDTPTPRGSSRPPTSLSLKNQINESVRLIRRGLTYGFLPSHGRRFHCAFDRAIAQGDRVQGEAHERLG